MKKCAGLRTIMMIIISIFLCGWRLPERGIITNNFVSSVYHTEENDKYCKLTLIVSVRENAFFHKDSVDVYLDGKKITTVEQGGLYRKAISVSQDEHTISVQVGDTEPDERTLFVNRDKTFNCEVWSYGYARIKDLVITVDDLSLDTMNYSLFGVQSGVGQNKNFIFVDFDNCVMTSITTRPNGRGNASTATYLVSASSAYISGNERDGWHSLDFREKKYSCGIKDEREVILVVVNNKNTSSYLRTDTPLDHEKKALQLAIKSRGNEILNPEDE